MAGPIGQIVTFRWEGSEAKRSINEATRNGLEFAAADAVILAQDTVRKRTRRLMGDITASVPRRSAGAWTIRFGAFTVPYAFWQEVLPEEAGGRSYIRYSADIIFPKIGDYIRDFLPAKFKGLTGTIGREGFGGIGE